jgi:hypothetical protein
MRRKAGERRTDIRKKKGVLEVEKLRITRERNENVIFKT